MGKAHKHLRQNTLESSPLQLQGSASEETDNQIRIKFHAFYATRRSITTPEKPANGF
jgi:hypothetical protein